ncbi:MAG: efflux RND transporter periplasmic adaptor subunit [Thermodesulfobacteriota bacterium]
MKRRAVTTVFLLLGALLLLQAAGCGRDQPEERPPGPEAVRVEAEVVRPTPINDVLILPGETKPLHDVRLAADLGGLIESVEFKEGDRVKQGDLLAKIDVSALKAALESAEADLDLARKQFARRQELYDRQIISQEELDQSRTTLLVKEGLVRQAQALYEDGFVRSPVDGVVNFVHVDPGEFVGQGAPIMDVVNVDRLEIEVNVPELDVRYFQVGRPALVRVDALPDLAAGGETTFVAFKADPLTKTFRVKVMMDNAEGLVRPGMIARVAFLRRTIPDALTAPLFALVDKEGERLVFVEKDGKAQARTISFGVIEGDRVQITEGLEPGDRLIVKGQTEVEDGTPVLVTLRGEFAAGVGLGEGAGVALP